MNFSNPEVVAVVKSRNQIIEDHLRFIFGSMHAVFPDQANVSADDIRALFDDKELYADADADDRIKSVEVTDAIITKVATELGLVAA